MAVAGKEAKDKLMEKIIAALGDSYQGMYDSKYYFLSKEGGSNKQVCISLTCPKVPVEFGDTPNNHLDANGDWDFSEKPRTPTNSVVAKAPPAEITEEEKQNVANLLAKLGL